MSTTDGHVKSAFAYIQNSKKLMFMKLESNVGKNCDISTKTHFSHSTNFALNILLEQTNLVLNCFLMPKKKKKLTHLKQCWTPLSFHKRFMIFANSGVNSPSSAALANVKKCRASS